VLEFLAKYIKDEGIAPSIYETANALGLPYSGTREAMIALEKAGFIKRRFMRPRAISIVRMPEAA
jgi:SOS-response transcriptional repressor LexA